jgi:hypothetical protein
MKKLGIDPNAVSEHDDATSNASDTSDTSRLLSPPIDVSSAE